MAVCQNLVPLVNIKIAGIWMFIPLKMVLIGIDPYPYIYILKSSWLVCPMGSLQEALPYLEEALELCRDATILTWFAWVAWTADWEVETSRKPSPNLCRTETSTLWLCQNSY